MCVIQVLLPLFLKYYTPAWLVVIVVVAPPCFCLNGGSYVEESGCVCADNFVGAFCTNSTGKSNFVRTRHE